MAIVVVAVAVLAGACASGSSPQAGTSVTTATPSTSPSAAGSGTTALQPIDKGSLEAAFAAGVERTGAPGGVAIVDTPQGRFTLSAGTNEVGRDVKPSATDHFRIGSTTKTMVGAVILQLAQEGKLRLDDPVSTYVGGVPGGGQITIEQLINMRSGLPSYTNTSEIGGALDRDPTRVWTPQELLAAAFKNPPHAAPGTAFYYSNTNTVLAGLIIEKLDGKSLAQSLHDRLFQPLGMNDTSLPPTTSNGLPESHGRGYLYGTNEIFLRIDPTLPPDLQAQLDAGTLPRHDVTDENPSWGWAAGNGISTAHDMMIWIDALVDGKVLNPEYQQKWLAPGDPTDPAHPDGIHYGLAHYSIPTPDGHTLYGHSGEIPGFNTWMLRDPVNDVTIVAWANLAPNHGDEAFIGALVNTIYRTPATSATTAPNTGPSAGSSSFAGLVDIGGGRQVYLQCQGRGSPTVVLVSGAQGAHDDWTDVADANNPGAAPQPSDSAVFPQIARFTRVCAFDRPGTTLMSGAPSPSTPVAQPTTAAAGVADLTAVLAAADEPGPYVLAGASWGGMIANLYARTNPAAVAGLVFVDAASEFLKDTLTPAQWTAWMQLNQTTATSPTVEIPDYQAAVDEIGAAPALPSVPAAVLTADHPWNLPLGDAGPTWPAWTAAQDRLASLLHATHITHTDSGHPINIDQPQVVTDAIHNIVTTARQSSEPPN